MAHPAEKVSLPISVPGKLNKAQIYFRRHQHTSSRVQGFTLLELMIVIVIISILVSFATLTMRSTSPEDLIKEEAQRLQRLIQLALEEAVMKNTEYALEFSSNSYRFLSYNDGNWDAISDDQLLRERELPHEMEVDLAIEQIDVIIGKSPEPDSNTSQYGIAENSDEKEKPKPQVFLLSSEEITPEFSAYFTLPGIEARYVVSGHIDGKSEFKLSDL